MCSPATTTSAWLKPFTFGRPRLESASAKHLRSGSGSAASWIVDLVEAVRGEHRHRALVGPEAARDVDRLPGRSCSRSAKQKAYLPGLPSVARSSRPGRVCITFIITRRTARPIVALGRQPCPNALLPGVQPDPVRDRAADDQDHRRAAGARGRPVIREVGVAEPADRGDDHRHVLGTTARQDRVDRDLLRDDHGVPARDLAENRVATQRGTGQHLGNGFLGRRDDGQPIGPAALEVRLDQARGIGLGGRRHARYHTPAGGRLMARPGSSGSRARSRF